MHYADPNLDYDHAALAGATLAQPDPAGGYYPIGRLVRTYHPRVIVAMWNTNDIRQGATAESGIRLYTSWLRTVRAEDPDVDVVIARLPWTWMSPQVGRLNAQPPLLRRGVLHRTLEGRAGPGARRVLAGRHLRRSAPAPTR